tara:strand:+ start:140 stop:1120 length:981 start_codon:yes stop_codon:yes gene_type:complete
MKKIIIIGGGGYVGADLVPKLLKLGYSVTVYDLFIYGIDVLDKHENLKLIKGDIRNKELLEKSIIEHDTLIHLACISNDPSFELNPELGKSINLDSFRPLVEVSRKNKIKRFIYASSSSVYGIKKEKNVNENLLLEPLTDYSKFKVECENILQEYTDKMFQTVIIRPATVCGYSKRQRLDVVVNILTNLAFNLRKIKIFGGDQLRPNINIHDMSNVYLKMIEASENLVNGEIFNAGYENLTVNEIGDLVKKIIGEDVLIDKVATDDNRSYHISSQKIKDKINFQPLFNVEDAIKELKTSFEQKKLLDSLNNTNYFNIKKMQEIKLK